MNRKASAGTIEIVIAFAILAVILVVTFYLINNNNKMIVKNTDCSSKGGSCQTECEGNIVSYSGCQEKQVCCVKLGG
jgi:uncharacterized membrane protein YqiK